MLLSFKREMHIFWQSLANTYYSIRYSGDAASHIPEQGLAGKQSGPSLPSVHVTILLWIYSSIVFLMWLQHVACPVFILMRIFIDTYSYKSFHISFAFSLFGKKNDSLKIIYILTLKWWNCLSENMELILFMQFF